MQLNFPSCFEAATRARTEPFLIFEQGDFLAAEDFKSLDQSFPELDGLSSTGLRKGGKAYLDTNSSEFHVFLDRTPAWAQFYETVRSSETLDRLSRSLAPHLTHRSGGERLPWLLNDSVPHRPTRLIRKINKLRRNLSRLVTQRTKVRVHLEFSVLGNGTSIPPHTDAPRKLLSLMLYFPDPGWPEDARGGTEFYAGKPGVETERGWETSTKTAPLDRRFFERHETIHTLPFVGNTLYGFVKTGLSWHGVPTFDIPDGMTRRSLNININLDD